MNYDQLTQITWLRASPDDSERYVTAGWAGTYSPVQCYDCIYINVLFLNLIIIQVIHLVNNIFLTQVLIIEILFIIIISLEMERVIWQMLSNHVFAEG